MAHRFHKFDPALAERLVSPDRARLLPPDEVFTLLDVRPGDVVADIGCGPGFFTLPLAARVRPGGRVLAMDTSTDMLEHLRARLAPDTACAVEVLLSGESLLPVEDGAYDRALLANLLHELVEPEAFFAEVARTLRPDGLGLAIDWYPHETPFGPPLAARVPPETAAAWIRAAGLQPWPARDIGGHNYAVAFRHRSAERLAR